MTSRRDALAWLGAIAATGCGSAARAPPASQGTTDDLQLDPIVDIVPAVGLQWLLQAKPRELFADDVTGPALAGILPASRLDLFARSYGGVDLRQASEVVLAGYADTTLALARVEINPARVEAAFTTRAIAVEGRAVDHGVTRVWGTVSAARVQVAIFGRQAVAIEVGQLGPLRPAIYFAQGRLKRARPALRTEPLVNAAAGAGDGPLRGFAPGPFEGPWAAGLGGLLRAATCVAATVRSVRARAGAGLGLRVLVSGAWGDDAPAAAERLAAAFQVLAADPLGHLLGADQPISPVRTNSGSEQLELDLVLDPVTLTRGLRAATGADLAEILRLAGAH